MDKSITCKNCGYSINNNFCSNCGQKWINKRFTLRDSVISVINALFNADRGFLYTTKDVVIKPASVIANFLDGITIRYVHPFRFLLIWATINTILAISLGTYDEQTQMINEDLNYSQEQIELNTKVQSFIKKYLNLVILLTVPFVSLFSWLFYRKKKFFYAEHLVLNSYGYSLVSILGAFVVIIEAIMGNPKISMIISLSVNLLVMAFVYMKFFKENYLKSLLKFIASFVLSYLVTIIIGSILAIIALIIDKAT